MSGMFDERTGVLAHWGVFPSFRELDPAFGGCITLGSYYSLLIRDYSILLPFLALIPFLVLWLSIVLYL